MATKHWRFPDGLRIPHHTDSSRRAWDRKYHQAVVDVFGYGDPNRLKKVKVPVTEEIGGHFVQGPVGPGGRNRHPTYRKMLEAGDRLPPVVVRRNGISWTVVDGNARLKAALDHGTKTLDALEMVEAPDQPGLKKAEDPDVIAYTRKTMKKLLAKLDEQEARGDRAQLTGNAPVIENASYQADEDQQIKEDVQRALLHPQLNPADARVCFGMAYRTEAGPVLGDEFYQKAVGRWSLHPEVVHRIGRLGGISPETVHKAVTTLLGTETQGPAGVDPTDRSNWVKTIIHGYEQAEPRTLKAAVDDFHQNPGDWDDNPASEVVQHPRFGEIEPSWVRHHLDKSFSQPAPNSKHYGIFAQYVANSHPEMISPEFLKQRIDHGHNPSVSGLIFGLGLAERRGLGGSPALTADNLVAAVKMKNAFRDGAGAGRDAIAHPNMPSDFVDAVVDPDSGALEKHFGGTGSVSNFVGGSNLVDHVLRTPGLHRHLRPATVQKLAETPGFGYGKHLLEGPHGSPELLDIMLAHRDPQGVGMHPMEFALASGSEHLRPRHLQQVLDDPSWDKNDRSAAIQHPNLPAADLHSRIKTRLQNTAPGVAAGADEYDHDQVEMAVQGLATGRLSLEQLKDLQGLGHQHPNIKDALRYHLSVQDPDSSYQEQVGVKLGVAKHRLVRDAITATGRTEAAPNQLPPGDWSQARLKNGNVSSERLQALIDARLPRHYNISHDTWEGGQRHSKDHSNVFQVNMTTAHLKAMKEAGVYDTFKKMHEASLQSGHPLNPDHGLGWVRWTGEPSQGVFMDEVQSDFGQSWGKTGYSQGRAEALRRGHSEAEAHGKGLENQALVDKEYPPADREKVKEILFGSGHPNEVLTEAFHQWLRDKGHADTLVHIHSVESKAPISLGRPLDRKCKSCGEKGNHKDHTKTVGEPGYEHDFIPASHDFQVCAQTDLPAGQAGSASCSGKEHQHPQPPDHPFVPGEVDRAGAPAHFNVTYHDLPKKMGKTAAKYGDLSTQSSESGAVASGTPTWGGAVRKSEKRPKQETQIASIAAFRDGKLLVGKRNDNGLWTLPGGHVEVGEEHKEAGRRELLEEAGLAADYLEYIGSGIVSKGKKTLRIYCYKAQVSGEASGAADPDQECSEWRWVEGLPAEIADNLHSQENVTLRLLGLQAGAVRKADDFLMEFQDLRKAPFQDGSWGSQAAKTYTGDLRGFKAREYRGTEQLAAHVYLHEYDAPFGNKAKSFHVTSTPEPIHESHRPVDMFAMATPGADGLRVETTVVHPDHQKKGLASLVYRHLARRHGGRLYSGGSQAPEAQRLWESLARDPEAYVEFGAAGTYQPHVLTLRKADEAVWWHGTPSGDFRGGTSGLHVGTKLAAEQAIHARIGIPVDGVWDGSREYGKVLLAGQKTLRARGLFQTGYNSRAPEEDHYPVIGTSRYSDNSSVAAHHRPNIVPVQIIGPMSNTVSTPHPDFKANGYMAGQLKRGSAKRGFYYSNQGEDVGRVSATVPGPGHVRVLESVQKALPQKSKAEFQEMLAGIAAKNQKLDARIQELVATTSASVWAHGDGLHTVVAPDPHNRNQWRATRLGPGGEPWGHDVASDHVAALEYADGNGADLHQQPKSFLKKDEEGDIFEDLRKGLAGLSLAGALAVASGGATQATPQQATGPASVQARPWSPRGLHPGLLPIAHLESSFGLNTNHTPDPRGEYYSAFGALGLKSVTAHEQYRRTPTLQKLYPGLDDPADFTAKLKSDPSFYNLVGSAHYLWLRNRHGSPEKAAFAWRHGTGAAANSTPDQVNNEVYVQKYRALAAGLRPPEPAPATMPTGLKP